MRSRGRIAEPGTSTRRRPNLFHAPRWEGLSMRWASGVWGATRTMSLRRRVFITKVLYDKHFHGKNLAKLNNAEIDTTYKLCHSARDG